MIYEQARQIHGFLCRDLQIRKNLNGKQVAALFTQYQVWEYLYSCFEALHTTCANYIVEDIDLYIQARQPA